MLISFYSVVLNIRPSVKIWNHNTQHETWKNSEKLKFLFAQAFPLPPSIPSSIAGGPPGGLMGGLFGKRDSGGGGGPGRPDDIEDLRVPPQSASASPPPPPPPPVGPFAGTNGSPVGGLRLPLGPPAGGPLAGLSPKDIMALAATGAGGGGGLGLPGGPAGPLPGPMGSALLDTYLSMIAAAGGGGGEGGGGAAGAMASALQSFGRFGAAAAAKHNASGKYHVKHDLLIPHGNLP